MQLESRRMSHLCVKEMRMSINSCSEDLLSLSKDRTAIVKLTTMPCGVLTAGADLEAQSRLQGIPA